jgi:hypothetical protein
MVVAGQVSVLMDCRLRQDRCARVGADRRQASGRWRVLTSEQGHVAIEQARIRDEADAKGRRASVP